MEIDENANNPIYMYVTEGKYIKHENDTFRNILLGRPDAVRKISIMSDAINRTFETIEITNEDLAIAFRSQRNMYNRLKNSQKNSSSSTSPFEEELPF